MGYDMRWMKRHEAEWTEDKDAHYFRLNIGGMGWMRGLLAAADVLDRESRHPAFPDVVEYGEPGRAAYNEACDTVRQARSPHYPEQVPAFKFGTNDGWVVSPTECETLANALRLLLKREGFTFGTKAERYEPEFKEADARELAEKFASYCAGAVEHGGFEVW